MEALGINLGFLMLQLALCSAIYLLPLIFVVLNLRDRTDIDGQTKLLWVLIVIIAPILGALAYLIFGRNQT